MGRGKTNNGLVFIFILTVSFFSLSLSGIGVAFSSGTFANQSLSGLSLVNSQSDVADFAANILGPTPLWRFNSFANYQTDVSIPTVINGLVYAVVNGDSDVRILCCLNASTGNEMWTAPTNVFDTFDVYTVASGYVFRGSAVQLYADSAGTKGVITCLSGVDGHQLWTYVNGTGFGTPIFAGGIVYDDTINNAKGGALMPLMLQRVQYFGKVQVQQETFSMRIPSSLQATAFT